jgi:hypothetical protein
VYFLLSVNSGNDDDYSVWNIGNVRLVSPNLNTLRTVAIVLELYDPSLTYYVLPTSVSFVLSFAGAFALYRNECHHCYAPSIKQQRYKALVGVYDSRQKTMNARTRAIGTTTTGKVQDVEIETWSGLSYSIERVPCLF